MTLRLFGMFVVALLLGAVGQLSMKVALKSFTDHHGPLQGVGMLLMAMVSPGVAFGLTCYVLSSMMYLFILSRIPMSMLYPMVALNYVFVTFLAWAYLKEDVPVARLAGLAIIIAGVVTVAMSDKPKPVERPMPAAQVAQ